MEFTKEQIEGWRQQFGELFQIDIEDKRCILKKPARKTLSFATSVATKDPIKFNEILLKDCWVAGDEEIKTNDKYFLAASAKLSEVLEVAEASIVKL